ncbi:hypothetical protein NAT51_03315 [Flavobacterium amniphilum]|uniref:hypothetical protein n=1 Tax=Flavobacterium amniphilum TaxID=1834035 RepID=UPI00202A9216|nr:hypothetical protein [Flavobacterium amniphilum]MCL9804535.1 hypothetical protein [Flavobacterium amniphilum]
MRKVVIIILVALVIGVLIWQQSLAVPNTWVQIMGFILLFYGMMRLSRKVPSKNQDEKE